MPRKVRQTHQTQIQMKLLKCEFLGLGAADGVSLVVACCRRQKKKKLDTTASMVDRQTMGMKLHGSTIWWIFFGNHNKTSAQFEEMEHIAGFYRALL